MNVLKNETTNPKDRDLLLEEFRKAEEDELFLAKTIAAIFKSSSVWVRESSKKPGFIPCVRVKERHFFQKKDILEWIGKNKVNKKTNS